MRFSKRLIVAPETDTYNSFADFLLLRYQDLIDLVYRTASTNFTFLKWFYKLFWFLLVQHSLSRIR